jgi:hypothetical protein
MSSHHIIIGEPDTCSSQLIDIRCADVCVSRAAQCISPLIVGKKKQDIGSLLNYLFLF